MHGGCFAILQQALREERSIEFYRALNDTEDLS